MAIEVDAVYENGVLKLDAPLQLQEGKRVRITIRNHPNWVEESAGMFGFKGTVEEADFIASDPELDYPPEFKWGGDHGH